MNRSRSVFQLSLTTAVVAYPMTARGQESVPPIPDPQNSAAAAVASAESEELTVLLRGPLHEGYAEQFTTDPEPGITIDRQPPELIDEVPPEYRPEGEDIAWIPGYWGWDPEASEFVWVSGIWRQIPPGHQWVPGYWAEARDGFQWISGFWTPTDQIEISYLPAPPPSIDNGPSSESPNEEFFWVPGNWIYDASTYVWQSGYWSPAYENWVWVPARYVWTPSGCIYRPGYWDFVIADRGTIFCPVRIANPTPTFRYQPVYVVDTSPAWYANLFVAPNYNHYMYGNYYGYNAAANSRFNLYPWITYYQTSRRYDPLYGYYAYQQRNAGLIRQIATLHRYISVNQNLRPARTFLDSQRFVSALSTDQQAFALRAATISNVASRQADFTIPYTLTSVDTQITQQITQAINPVRDLVRQRRDLERATDQQDELRARIRTDQDFAGGDASLFADVDAQRFRLGDNGSPLTGTVGALQEAVGDAIDGRSDQRADRQQRRGDRVDRRDGDAQDRTDGDLVDRDPRDPNRRDPNAPGRDADGRSELEDAAAALADRAERAADRTGDRADRAGDRAADRADNLTDRAGQAGERMRDRAGDAANRLGNAGDAAREAANGDRNPLAGDAAANVDANARAGARAGRDGVGADVGAEANADATTPQIQRLDPAEIARRRAEILRQREGNRGDARNQFARDPLSDLNLDSANPQAGDRGNAAGNAAGNALNPPSADELQRLRDSMRGRAGQAGRQPGANAAGNEAADAANRLQNRRPPQAPGGLEGGRGDLDRLQQQLRNRAGQGNPNAPGQQPGVGGDRGRGQRGGNLPGGANLPGAGNRPGGNNTPGAGNAPGAGNLPGGGNLPGAGNLPGGANLPGVGGGANAEAGAAAGPGNRRGQRGGRGGNAPSPAPAAAAAPAPAAAAEAAPAAQTPAPSPAPAAGGDGESGDD